MKRKPKSGYYERDPYERESYDRYQASPQASPKSRGSSNTFFNLNYTSLAIFGCVFMLGVGVGIGFSSTTSFNPESIDSSIEIDQQAPDTELCVQFGASAIVTDVRMFVTLKPFNVFVTQPITQPGCVLRRNNWSLLEQKSLITSDQVRDCKQRMNTFGFTGTLEGTPKINCIYQNDAAGNLFLDRSNSGNARPETENF